MRIKTFQAPTMQEALSQARAELGDEAVVLNTRQVKAGGMLGLGSGSRVELTAAVDDAPAPVAAASKAVPPVPRAVVTEPAVPTYNQLASVTAPKAPVATLSRESDAEVAQLRMELRQLTSVVQGLISSKPVETASVAHRPLLLRLGIDEEVAKRFLGELLVVEDPASLAPALAARMQSFAQPPVCDEPRVIALVGPTGVGKTTTLAKLAARFSLEQGKKVALVTADTFRIGAVEQLRTYARIMGVPLEIALSPDEVRAGVQKHSDCDVVLVDTVGRSHRNADHLRELKSFLDAAGGIETHLVIAASLSAEIQKEVVENFAVFSPSRLIVTKLDESPTRGCLVNLPLSTGLGLSCMTAGQNVPQDIELAEAGAIARLVTEVA